ncbi:MAG: endonuclease/exonuclease/phosphatase family protein [Hydrogenophaga sp.]|uniref:endonuclease/exonuclease/phosphatase family protein n=1 Tax=Hydrogenophaga sp. TaxID=1904254 RepID=UPI003D9BE7B2
MRLVSLNTWKAEGDHPRRLRAMAVGLQAMAPHVVALQEDLRTADGQIHTAQTLAHALGLPLHALPARAKRRRVGKVWVDSTAGLAVLSRRPVREQRALVLPQDPRDGERLAQCLRLEGEQEDWWLVNLHLSHLPDRADLRRAQLGVVLEALDRWAGAAPVVLCGDFNAAPQDLEIAGCVHPRGPLVDVFGGRTKCTHRTPEGAARDLDHIFLRMPAAAPAVAVHAATVVLDRADAHGVLPSDHFGVCADLSL